MNTAAPFTERPEVAANFALTWDGRISTRNRTPSDFSSPLDKRRLLEIRATGDAVLAGAATVAADRMSMGMPAEDLRNERLARGQSAYPLRVLLTNNGWLDPTLPVFQHRFSPVHIFATRQMPQEVRATLADVATLHFTEAETVDPVEVMHVLRHDFGIRRLICEGGARVFRSLLQADLVDEINLTFCPRIFGSEQAPTLTGPAGAFLPASMEYRLEQMDAVGEECFLRYRRGGVEG